MLAAFVLVSSPGGTALLAWSAWRRHRAISSASTTASTTAANTAISGHTGSPGRGVLRAPRSGAECVWYQIEYAHSPTRDDHLERWVDFHPGAELVPVTDGSGTVYLTPELARTTLIGPAIAAISASGRDGDTAWQEVIIPPGVPVFAIGKPARVQDVGPLKTVIVEKGFGFLPHAGFPMGTGHRPSPVQDGVVLQARWLGLCGVTTLPAEQVRRRYALSFRRAIVLLLGLPALGFALIGIAAALQG